MPPVPILLDTDIGDDVDDALALVLALHSPEVHLAGVTTVFRDAPRRAVLAREVLRLLGREEVPIRAGCSEPLLPDWENLPYGGREVGRQFEALDPTLKWEDDRHAVLFIIEQARAFAARGERLTLVTIGAMTNVALALRLAPDIVPLCRVVSMAGKLTEAMTEWNVLCDPEAAALVLGSGVDLSLVGLDVTSPCVLSGEERARFPASPHPHARFLDTLIDLWGNPVTLHDPLTILTLFTDAVRFEPRRVEVGLVPGAGRATTTVVAGPANVRAGVSVDAGRAKAMFLERVLASP